MLYATLGSQKRALERGAASAWVSIVTVAVVAIVSIIASFEIVRTAPPFTPPVVPGATTTAALIQEQAAQLPSLMMQGDGMASTSATTSTTTSTTTPEAGETASTSIIGQ